jgi:hypothetical protein
MPKKHVGDVGEHWVLYRLVRQGYTAVLAPTNTRSVDILVSDEHGRAVSSPRPDLRMPKVERRNARREEREA